MVQQAQRGYEVDAVGFMVKPVSYYDFALKFKKALEVYSMNEKRNVTITVPGGMCRISVDKLMYVEIVNHKLRYHLVDEVLEMSGSLSVVEKELESYGLLRCNSCYLVNPKFIRSVRGLELSIGDETLRISRPKRQQFITRLTEWFSGGRSRLNELLLLFGFLCERYIRIFVRALCVCRAFYVPAEP